MRVSPLLEWINLDNLFPDQNKFSRSNFSPVIFPYKFRFEV